MFGHMDREEAVIEKITMTHNVLESPITFQVDPEEFLRALVEAEKDGLQLVGFFHPHPADASPSDTDLAYMRLWPDSIWLVISSISYDMSAYQITNGSPPKVRIEVNHV